VVLNPRIASPSAIRDAKILLEGVVERGTGSGVRETGFRVAGKTGTVQIAANNKGYRQGTNKVQHKGSFVGYFPADDPRYSCIVVIVNPKKGKYFGGAVAAPVFRELSEKLYANGSDIMVPLPMDVTPDRFPIACKGMTADLTDAFRSLGIPYMPGGVPTTWARPVAGNGKMIIEPEGIPGGIMPDVTGMGLSDALFLLEQMGLKVLVKGKGIVEYQSVPPGTAIRKGIPVRIDLQPNSKNKTRT
jgi:cell division protein FtsI (penicillin-binding protein 3)